MTLAELTPALMRLSPTEKVQAVQILTASLADVWPGIQKTPDVCGGDARVGNTRITVWLLENWRRLGVRDEELLRDYPALLPNDLTSARAYAAAHSAEIENAIRRNTEA